MKTETMLLIGAAVIVVLMLQQQPQPATNARVGMVRGTRMRLPDTMPRYDGGSYGSHYGNSMAGDGPNGGVQMWVNPPGPAGTYPALNAPAIGPNGNVLDANPDKDSTQPSDSDFGPRPANWPMFLPWPTELMKQQQLNAARRGIAAILHGNNTNTALGATGGAGGGTILESPGLGHFIVHV